MGQISGSQSFIIRPVSLRGLEKVQFKQDNKVTKVRKKSSKIISIMALFTLSQGLGKISRVEIQHLGCREHDLRSARFVSNRA